MNLVKIKVILKDEDSTVSNIEVNGYHHEEKQIITYIDRDEKKTHTEFHYGRNELIRDNEEMYLVLSFSLDKNSKGKLIEKQTNKELLLNIRTRKIEQNNNFIFIEYELEDKLYTLEMKMEE